MTIYLRNSYFRLLLSRDRLLRLSRERLRFLPGDRDLLLLRSRDRLLFRFFFLLGDLRCLSSLSSVFAIPHVTEYNL